MKWNEIIAISLIVLLLHTSAGVLGQTIKPSDYWTFKPPAVGESYNDPVFNTSIKRLTDSQGVFGFNGERAMFSTDDKYFVVAVDRPSLPRKRLHLFDGRTGDLIRILPNFVSDRTIVRWGYDPEVLVYAEGNNLKGFNVVTDVITTLATFSEAIGDATGMLCGGDGNDFDDAGEWLLLNKGPQDANGLPGEMFAYNIRTGETGPVKDMSSYLIDYCTISPSGQYIVGTSFDPAATTPGLGKKWIWNRDWTNEREITESDGTRIGNAHMDLAYLDGTDECLVTKLSGGVWAIRFSDLNQFNVLSASGLGIIMYSAVGGSNRNHIYLAVESKGLDPDVAWSPYLGELVQVPLVTTGPGEISRLAHHRARTHDGSFHQFVDQPEPWINHAGDRLFFRSNMDNYTELGKNDLYMIELNEPGLGTDDEIQVNNELRVYPNPINDFVYVSLSNQAAQYQYRILDLSGRLMQQGFLDSNKINCSTLRSGVYLLTIFSQSESYSIKIVKN
ncbi:T9SS type A sorting domain-containing protein [Mariniflexile sp.]|uniref:T9SS type A sorting domain-containing protein n=1 Tax=Mariniflexile sp. TaxID=1979402 RepID=UPI004047E461